MIIDKDKLLHFYKLKNLVRFNLKPRVKDETVAEHSYFVAFFTSFICNELKLSDKIKNQALEYALVHDFSEIEISDIPHSFKCVEGVKDFIDKHEQSVIDRILPNYSKLFKDIRNGGNELIKSIVELADILSVIQYIYSEKDLGNTTLDEILTGAIGRCNLMIENIAYITDEKLIFFKE
jgi:putative hydrolase of HD superfamily